MKEDIINAIKERTEIIYADINTFLQIRSDNYLKTHPEIGGGNLTTTTMLFHVMNLLGKISYYIDRPDRFDNNGCNVVNETEVFVFFAKELDSNNLLSIPTKNGAELEKIWNGFRNHLVHRLTVETGKSVVHFEFSNISGNSLSDILTQLAHKAVFIKNPTGYYFYPDVLFSKVGDITEYVEMKVRNCKENEEYFKKLYNQLIN